MIQINLVNIDSQTFANKIDPELKKPFEHFEHELVKLRTGKAHTNMIEDILVTCYGGSTMKLKELAALSAPEIDLLIVQPWDISIIADIDKAIQTSDVGVTPQNDGERILIRLPRMSTQRRDELVKVLHKKLEECRTAIRNIRKEIKNLVTEAKKNKVASEDFAKILLELTQKKTDEAITIAEKKAEKKEQQLLQA